MDILGVERLTSEKWLNLYAAHFRHNDHEGRWLFASRRKTPQGRQCDAVLIVPILRDPGQPARLVLAKEFRVPAGSHVIGLPAGLMEPNETIESAVRRELHEETGFAVTHFKRITPPLFSSSGLTDEATAMAFVDCVTVPGQSQQLERSEEIEVLLLDYPAVCELCRAQDVFVDAKAWMALHLYTLLGALV